MKPVALLIIVLSQNGYWFAGQDQTISVQPSIATNLSAKLNWDLTINQVALAHGERLVGSKGQSVIKVLVPTARARCRLTWTYRLIGRGDSKVLEKGSLPVELFPAIELPDTSRKQLKRVVVLESKHDISAFLEQHHVTAERIADSSKLRGALADRLIVGPDILEGSRFEQAPIFEQARAGARVLILNQSHVDNLGDFPVERHPSHGICWTPANPLFASFEQDDLDSWSRGIDLKALQLPMDSAVDRLAFWKSESPGRLASSIDAAVAVESVGSGSVIFCQLPIDDVMRDPRAQMIICNALSYTRPQDGLPSTTDIGRSEPSTLQPPSVITLPIGER